MRVALIDADSIVYIIGWAYRDSADKSKVLESCDSFLNSIMASIEATHYIGVFSDKKCFRHDLYKYADYKGQRPEKHPGIAYWEPIIKEYFNTKYNFTMISNLEADDIICAIAEYYRNNNTDHVVCSPDKDLKQIPGNHYDYKKNISSTVSKEEAVKTLWLQVLTGDSTDNIAGLPKVGPVNALKLLDKAESPVRYSAIVKEAFINHFGAYYGNIIFKETLETVRLICENHSMYQWHGSAIINTSMNHINEFEFTTTHNLDSTILGLLGWDGD